MLAARLRDAHGRPRLFGRSWSDVGDGLIGHYEADQETASPVRVSRPASPKAFQRFSRIAKKAPFNPGPKSCIMAVGANAPGKLVRLTLAGKSCISPTQGCWIG
jgi:hypothetical protein